MPGMFPWKRPRRRTAGRPPAFQGRVGELTNMLGMNIGGCTVGNGAAPALVGDALFRALAAAGLSLAAVVFYAASDQRLGQAICAGG